MSEDEISEKTKERIVNELMIELDVPNSRRENIEKRVEGASKGDKVFLMKAVVKSIYEMDNLIERFSCTTVD